MIIYDIETAPLPEKELIVPEFTAPANYKDPEKIVASIKEQEAKWRETLALNPMTGRVVAIGYKLPDVLSGPVLDIDTGIDNEDNESDLISRFWNNYNRYPSDFMVGFNSNSFDLPFIVRRSWVQGVDVPSDVISYDNGYTKLSRRFVDLRKIWGLGDARAEGTLDEVARFLGVGKKSGSGKDFGALLKNDPAKAREYLANDIILTKEVALRLGVL